MRKFAAEQKFSEEQALQVGLDQKADGFEETNVKCLDATLFFFPPPRRTFLQFLGSLE